MVLKYVLKHEAAELSSNYENVPLVYENLLGEEVLIVG